tara:strand:+ start:401 stop:730 length:330 start_codon:yes stop_codon:yes gene_type:complete
MKSQLPPIIILCLLVGIAMMLMVCSGCMHTKGIKEMDVGIPALFQWEIEFNEDKDTSLDIIAPAIEDLPIAEVAGAVLPGGALGVGAGAGGVIAALSSLFLLKKKKKNV